MPLSEFQLKIVEVLETFLGGMANTWEIAQRAFPEKWARASGRGARVAHIRRAGLQLWYGGAIAFVLPAREQYCAATLCANR